MALSFPRTIAVLSLYLTFTMVVCLKEQHKEEIGPFGNKKVNPMEDIEGQNMVLSYHHPSNSNNSEEPSIYYMSNAEAYDNYNNLTRFIITKEAELDGNSIVSFKVRRRDTSTIYFLRLDSNSKILYTSTTKTTFCLVNVLGTSNYNLYNSDCVSNGLVTPFPHSRFTFYSQTRYPNEPLAEFQISLYQLNIPSFYAGLRANILETTQLIQNLTNIENKQEAYQALFNLMKDYGHVQSGKEIFSFAAYVYEDTGLSSLFAQLPAQVQLTAIPGQNLGLDFIPNLLNNETDALPMKYNFASELHENIQPYILLYSKPLDSWAFTYAPAHQLYLNSGGDLVEEYNSTVVYYNFQFHLNVVNSSIDSLQLRYRTTAYYKLVRITSSLPDYYFRSYGSSGSDNTFFKLNEYVVVEPKIVK